MKGYKILVSRCALLFIIFPYLTLNFPVSSDIQIWAALFSALFLILSVDSIRIDFVGWCLLLLSVFALTVAIFGDLQERQIFKALAVVYALVIYLYLLSANLDNDVYIYLILCLFLYAVISIFQYFFPEIYFTVFSHLVREVKVADIDGIRGVSALTTEPSFTAFCIIILFSLLYYSKGSARAPLLIALGLLCLMTVFLTKSLTGLVLVGLFLFIELLKHTKLLGLISFLLLAYVGYLYLDGTRAGDFMIALFSQPLSVISESSLFFRIYYFVYGIVSLIYNPFGYSFGNYDLFYLEHVTSNLFYDLVPEYTLSRIEPSVNMPSTFGANLYLYGFIYFLFYWAVFVSIFVRKRIPLFIKLLIFFLSAQSFSFGFPLLWLLIYFCRYRSQYFK